MMRCFSSKLRSTRLAKAFCLVFLSSYNLSFHRKHRLITVALASTLLVGCTPLPELNVLGYLIAERTGRLAMTTPGTGGTLTGMVLTDDGQPLAGATVLVAERTGEPHVAQSDASGRYRIEQIPPGNYVPAAVAPGYNESQLQRGRLAAQLITIQSERVTTAPPIQLTPHVPLPLPDPLVTGVQLEVMGSGIVTSVFPVGSVATVQGYRFTYAGAQVDTLRLYLPQTITPTQQLPMLFMIYPTAVDAWQSVSVAYAAQGYALVAISPVAARGLAIDAHATDARIGLALAQQGALGPHIAPTGVVALGGSFSSAILHRFLRDTGDAIDGWVTVGGIATAFSGAAAFYHGEIELPAEYTYLIPALGPPNLYPLEFLRYSPVYTAAQLPPTLIIHTDADLIIPIRQAYELENALRVAGVPVEVFYYQDVSHYLQIDAQMTDAGREMFFRVQEFADQHLK